MYERASHTPLSKFRVKKSIIKLKTTNINFLLVFTEAEQPNPTQATITKSDQEKAVENGECWLLQLLLSILALACDRRL
jgi:hypothetical protein